jgi:anti-anti-sigma factor
MATTERIGAVTVVRGNAALNVETADDFRARLEPCLQQGQPRIVLSMDNVPLIDSVGLKVLLDLQAKCLQRGGLCVMAGANALCRDILRVTRVDREFSLFDDVAAAVGSFAQ